MAIEMIKETKLEMGLIVQLYKNNSYPDKPYTVRLKDFDCGETVGCFLCPTLELAEIKYQYFLNN